ncbi:MAG: hypothetical protein ACREML_13300 [Vulcanimicrobiaceae bacterium]
MTISPKRKMVLAAVSCLLAIVLLRPLIAETLCIRGDEFLRSGDPSAAQHYYRLALYDDPNCRTAAERFAFASLEIHTSQALVAGVEVADAYLRRHDDQAIRADLALALWGVKDFARATVELRAVGKSARDARYERLAQIAERRVRDHARK